MSGNDPNMVVITITSVAPAEAQVTRGYYVLIPKDASGDDDILLQNQRNNADSFAGRTEECIAPNLSGVLQTRIRLFSERVLAELLLELKAAAEKMVRISR